ncbi:LOW QUALITY PROTEIN: hypothetical protein DAPPUDRAFT_241855 [Daphnia pulex]|uniref:Uncharacterized protein n=1 Tax=Daphnia pulex TaxID=6669 RepID=E9GF83_DAPPU|nr:LOW QUALITY PROTEIN: hypothetical protein DAPPUDRAFT_241855 [Daphnia pulex]|eukprot:EFX81854.1 LOW QUALITY PROTEIN: hypothetical protein DAPPUDRAFT_241855 [Daphnia pulex]
MPRKFEPYINLMSISGCNEPCYSKFYTLTVNQIRLVDVKLTFADSMTLRFINQRSAPMAKLPSFDAALPVSYSQAVRGHQAPILMASFASSAKPTDRISLAGIEDLLGSTGGCPVPASVRQKDDKIFVRLADPADLDRAQAISESKAGTNISRPPKLCPAVARFVNLSYLPSLEEELMIRNCGNKGKIESFSQLFPKPNSQKGHIKFYFTLRNQE